MKKTAQLLGKLTWAAVPYAPSHYRHLQRNFLEAGGSSGNSLNKNIKLSNQACSDLSWWKVNLSIINGKAFWLTEPDIDKFSDASLSGWGASCDQVTLRGPWSPVEKERHINELELIAALYALQAFTAKLSSINICLY